MQLLFQPFGHLIGQCTLEFVHIPCPLPAHILQILFRSLHFGRKGAFGNGADLFNGIGDFSCVGHHHFVGFFFAQVGKFLQHFLGRAQIQPGFSVRIGVFHTLLKDLPVNFILFLQKMHIAGGHHRLLQFLAQPADLPVHLHQLLVGGNLSLGDQKPVVAKRLDFEIVIIGGDLPDRVRRKVLQNRPVQLPRLAGGANNQSLPVGIQGRFGNSRNPVEIIQIAHGYQFIKILQPHQILCKKNHVVGRQFFGVGLVAHGGRNLLHRMNALLFQLSAHFVENQRQHPGILISSVVVKIPQTVVLGQKIQLVLFQIRVQILGKGNGIDVGIGEGYFILLAHLPDKAGIKIGVVRH